ncbi:MAG: Eco57I restriction-modification methylase domain-containing protein [Ignavibacteriae bacterium]|nr:Eco57I restriction-modification methylase domain-containing protein [Ignavibacteriota bacterium]
MDQSVNILPVENELPSLYADRLGIFYSTQVTLEHKKKSGQFFTPPKLAAFIASHCTSTKTSVKILDPGCGVGILTCSLVEALIKNNPHLTYIELVAYETDPALIVFARASLTYLQNWVRQWNIRIDFLIHENDFILSNSGTLENQNKTIEFCDVVISNPPYFKLQKSDGRARGTNSIVHGQPNMYSLFLFVAANLLEHDGELLFITPRSFTSGYYFRQFRQKFFSLVELITIHVFNSRINAFKRDGVLQETVIVVAKKKRANDTPRSMTISFSEGIHDLERRRCEKFKIEELLDIHSPQKILHLPTSDYDSIVMRVFSLWKGNLNEYNIQISTGPVVAFRAKKFIYHQPTPGIALTPLFWLHNISKMKIDWPRNKTGKGEFIQICEQSLPLLIPNKNYIFLRRFSSKDDYSRLIATPYFSETVDADLLGVENHLNYIYRPNGHLTRNELLGLSALFNSVLFDTYFRTFNGNVNVSSTELREMPLPPLETIQQIGDAIILQNEFTQPIVDEVVSQFFELEKKLSVAYE